MKKKAVKKMKGKGFVEDVDKWLKKSKVLSTVAGVVLPTVLGSAGGILTANPLGGLAGASVGALSSEYLKQIGYGQSGRGGGYQGSEYQNMTTALYSHKPSMTRGGAIYSHGQIPIHKNTGAGTARDYKTKHMVIRKPIMFGGGLEGMSVYNDVVSQYGNPKF